MLYFVEQLPQGSGLAQLSRGGAGGAARCSGSVLFAVLSLVAVIAKLSKWGHEYTPEFLQFTTCYSSLN